MAPPPSAPRVGRHFGGSPLCPLNSSPAPTSARRPSAPPSPAPSSSRQLSVAPSSECGDSDHCSLGDDLSVPGSPAGSCHSEQGGGFPTLPGRSGELQPRRASFEQTSCQMGALRVHQLDASSPQQQQPQGNLNERRGFLGRQVLAGASSSSPDASPGPSAAAVALVMRAQGAHSASELNTKRSFSAHCEAPSPNATRLGPAGMNSTGSGNSGKGMPTLREQVLIRSSSGSPCDGEVDPNPNTGANSEEGDDSSECLNFSEAEQLCTEREFEKDVVDGVHIVSLPGALSAPDTPDVVLYALVFTSNTSIPVLPGDDSIKLLFPQRMQLAAQGKPSRGAAKATKLPGFQPFRSTSEEQSSTAAVAAEKSRMASFASFKSYS